MSDDCASDAGENAGVWEAWIEEEIDGLGKERSIFLLSFTVINPDRCVIWSMVFYHEPSPLECPMEPIG